MTVQSSDAAAHGARAQRVDPLGGRRPSLKCMHKKGVETFGGAYSVATPRRFYDRFTTQTPNQLN